LRRIGLSSELSSELRFGLRIVLPLEAPLEVIPGVVLIQRLLGFQIQGVVIQACFSVAMGPANPSGGASVNAALTAQNHPETA
jgi:hypothetical protein